MSPLPTGGDEALINLEPKVVRNARPELRAPWPQVLKPEAGRPPSGAERVLKLPHRATASGRQDRRQPQSAQIRILSP